MVLVSKGTPMPWLYTGPSAWLFVMFPASTFQSSLIEIFYLFNYPLPLRLYVVFQTGATI
jgi:hypothetical protein